MRGLIKVYLKLYQLTTEKIDQLEFAESQNLLPLIDKVYMEDVAFKNDLKDILGNKIYSKNDGAILRSLDDKTTKFVSSRVHHFSHLLWLMLHPRLLHPSSSSF